MNKNYARYKKTILGYLGKEKKKRKKTKKSCKDVHEWQ